MRRCTPVDDFSLAYERRGSGDPVVMLHGWPGDHGDWRAVAALLGDDLDVVVPDLRGFGESDKHDRDPAVNYGARAQADSVLGLMRELALGPAVLAGYDVGSRVAQELARVAPDDVRALVISPPLPGVGERVLAAGPQAEFWYQAFHQLALAQRLIDGRPESVRAYLEHFWSHWSGPSFDLADADLDRLTVRYAPPGAFVASIGFYRAGAGTVARSLVERPPAPEDRTAVPTTILWPEHDPLFPPEWGDRVQEFFSAASVRALPGVGHFTPLEAPDAFVSAIRAAVG